MKRINHIVNPQGVRSEKLERQAERILRGVDQAIACLEDQVAEADEKAESIIDSLGTSSGSGDTASLQDKLNSYVKATGAKRRLNEAIADMKGLKDLLNKDIEIVVNPTHVVVDQK